MASRSVSLNVRLCWLGIEEGVCTQRLSLAWGMLISLSLIDSQPGNDPEHLNLACSSESPSRIVCLSPLPLQMTALINICLYEYFLVGLIFNRVHFSVSFALYCMFSMPRGIHQIGGVSCFVSIITF